MSITSHPSSKELPGCQALLDPASVASTPPYQRSDELYADYVLPEYGNTVDVANIIDLPAEACNDYGTAYPQLVPMNDATGTVYKVVRFAAAHPISDAWVVKDTAWGTQPEGLTNTDVAHMLMSLGFNVIVKGPEINSSIDLSKSAWNTHAILDAYHNLGYLDARVIAVEGYSRGAMIAFGTAAYAEHFKRLAIYLNLTDPCVAQPIKIDKEGLKKGLWLPLDLALLGAAVLQSTLGSDKADISRRTVDWSLQGAKQFVRTGRPLMNGEAGKLAARTPHDMHATIAFFRDCHVNDAKLFRYILSDRPDVRFVRPPGGHGGGLNERMLGHVALRFGRLGTQLSEGRRPEELDYLDIIHGVKLRRAA